MSTDTDGVVSPSVASAPEPGADGGVTADTGTSWLQEEIQRRMAAARTGAAGGRHARHGSAVSDTRPNYRARHASDVAGASDIPMADPQPLLDVESARSGRARPPAAPAVDDDGAAGQDPPVVDAGWSTPPTAVRAVPTSGQLIKDAGRAAESTESGDASGSESSGTGVAQEPPSPAVPTAASVGPDTAVDRSSTTPGADGSVGSDPSPPDPDRTAAATERSRRVGATSEAVWRSIGSWRKGPARRRSSVQSLDGPEVPPELVPETSATGSPVPSPDPEIPAPAADRSADVAAASRPSSAAEAAATEQTAVDDAVSEPAAPDAPPGSIAPSASSGALATAPEQPVAPMSGAVEAPPVPAVPEAPPVSGGSVGSSRSAVPDPPPASDAPPPATVAPVVPGEPSVPPAESGAVQESGPSEQGGPDTSARSWSAPATAGPTPTVPAPVLDGAVDAAAAADPGSATGSDRAACPGPVGPEHAASGEAAARLDPAQRPKAPKSPKQSKTPKSKSARTKGPTATGKDEPTLAPVPSGDELASRLDAAADPDLTPRNSTVAGLPAAPDRPAIASVDHSAADLAVADRRGVADRGEAYPAVTTHSAADLPAVDLDVTDQGAADPIGASSSAADRAAPGPAVTAATNPGATDLSDPSPGDSASSTGSREPAGPPAAAAATPVAAPIPLRRGSRRGSRPPSTGGSGDPEGVVVPLNRASTRGVPAPQAPGAPDDAGDPDAGPALSRPTSTGPADARRTPSTWSGLGRSSGAAGLSRTGPIPVIGGMGGPSLPDVRTTRRPREAPAPGAPPQPDRAGATAFGGSPAEPRSPWQSPRSGAASSLPRSLAALAPPQDLALPPTEAIPTVPGMPARTPSPPRAPDYPDEDLDDYDLDRRDDLDEDDDDDEFGDLDDAAADGIVWRAAVPPPPTPAVISAPQQEEPPVPQPPGKRVRVVLSERKAAARPVRTVVDLQEDGAVGELLRTGLISSQWWVAVRFALLTMGVLALLPLLFTLVPDIGKISVFGLRLPWLLLGVLVYPFLFGCGWLFTRSAERVEQDFADHVQDGGAVSQTRPGMLAVPSESRPVEIRSGDGRPAESRLTDTRPGEKLPT